MAQIHQFRRRPPRRGPLMPPSTAAWLLFLGGSALAWFLALAGVLSSGLAHLVGMAVMLGGYWALRDRLGV